MSTLDEITVPFTILNNPAGTGGHGGSWNRSGRTAFMNFAVRLEYLEGFLNSLAGAPQVFGTGTGATVTRTVPLQYPYHSRQYVDSVDYRMEGLDDLVTRDRPNTHAIVTVKFAVPEFDYNGENPWLTVRIHGSSNILTLPGYRFTFAGNGELVEQDVGRHVGQLDIQVTRHQVPDLAAVLESIKPLVGKVSSADLTIEGTVYAAGSLLFPTFEAEKAYTSLGGRHQQLDYTVVYRSLDWNQAMRTDGTYDTLVPAPHPTADLAPLFT